MTIKRKAFVGLTGPLFYDYKNMLNSKFPNPVLEAPMGLSLLYDEIVFLDERVCPKNMQKLDFVKFLSDSDLKDYREQLAEGFQLGGEVEISQYVDPDKIIEPIQQRIAPFSKWKDKSVEVDNFFTPNSYDPIQLIIDDYIANKEILYPISNSATDQRHRKIFNKLKGTKITENLISNIIPNYLTESGPHPDVINEFRNKPNVKEFREKIDVAISANDKKSIEKITTMIDKEFEYLKDYLLNKKVFEGRIYNAKHSIPKIVGLEVADVIKSSVGKPYQWADKLLGGHMDRKYYGWISFLIQVEKDEKKRKWEETKSNL